MTKFAPIFLRGTAVAVWLAASASTSTAATCATNSIADAFVAAGPTGNLSADNFGAAGALAVSAPGLPQGEFQTVLRFDLSGARSSLDAQFGAGLWAVQSVTLQLTASPHNNAIFNNIAAGEFGVSWMQNDTWVEGTGTGGVPTMDGISYNTLTGAYINAAADQALGTFSFGGGSSGASSYSLALAPGVLDTIQSGGDMSLRLFAADPMVSYLFSARGTANGPELIITAVPEPRLLILLGGGMILSAFCWRVVEGRGTRPV